MFSVKIYKDQLGGQLDKAITVGSGLNWKAAWATMQQNIGGNANIIHDSGKIYEPSVNGWFDSEGPTSAPEEALANA